MKKRKSNYKEIHVNIQQLISVEELVSLFNLKAKIERQNNRIKRRENKVKHR